jgi:hypothetical protein
VVAVAGAIILLFPPSGRLYEAMHVPPGPGYAMYQEEGVDGIVVTYVKGENVMTYIGGIGHGGRPVPLFYHEALEAMAYGPRIQNDFVLGYGTGSTVEALLQSDEVRNITLVELSDTLIRNVRKIALFERMLADPRIDLVIDDGRRFLLRTHEKYDLILIDPQRTTTAYSNNLYSKEFFELVRDHLTDEGVFMVWVDEQRVMPKTVLSVFDHLRKYRYFVLASKSSLTLNAQRRRVLYARFPPDLRAGIEKLAGNAYLGDQEYVRAETRMFPVNRDWKPVCEYYLGLRLREKSILRAQRSGLGRSAD